MLRVHLKSLGCRLNEAELETWARQFQKDGHRIVNDEEEADLVVFNSCAVTQDAVRKSRHLIRRTARENPHAKLILSGCYATLNRTEAENLGVDLVVTNEEKNRLVAIAKQELALPTMPVFSTERTESVLFRLGRQRAFIKVQDGCRYRCTYCIVTLARGEERSRTVDEIVDEIKSLEEQGIQEAVLTGVHLGGYGSDLGIGLDQLIRSILEETSLPRLRLGSLEPWDLPSSFSELFANPRLMPHLHLPLQSGSDSVLKRMARRCKTLEFAGLVEKLRRHVPDINITTDIIVGFPGESEAEWNETLALIERIGFGHMHIFSYSARDGTAAAKLPNPVADSVKKERSQWLHQLAETQKQAMLRSFLGREFPVLWEAAKTREDGRQMISGLTPNYLRVAMDTEYGKELFNRITTVQLTQLEPSGNCIIGAPAL
jgi:threonylcarbamoyladenosine tRNA methylthiotransferase MtaB